MSSNVAVIRAHLNAGQQRQQQNILAFRNTCLCNDSEVVFGTEFWFLKSGAGGLGGTCGCDWVKMITVGCETPSVEKYVVGTELKPTVVGIAEGGACRTIFTSSTRTTEMA